MRSLILLLSPFAYLLQTQSIAVKRIESTPTQAVIVFEAPDTVNCTVRVAYDQNFTKLVHDSNPALFSGAQNCGRAGNLIRGNTVTFVAGLRRAQKAPDGKFYSRALEADTVFWFEISSGGQTSAPATFRTEAPPFGKMYPEQYPFDSEAPGNYGWPTVDWSNAAQEIVDPLTGVALKRLTGPGMISRQLSPVGAAVAAMDAGGAWTNPGNGVTSDGNTASIASSQAALFVRLPQMCISPYGCGIGPIWQSPAYTQDNIQISLKAWCTTPACSANASGERNVELCLSVDGVSCATAWKTVTVGTSSGAAEVSYPATVGWNAFQDWLGGVFTEPPARPHMTVYVGQVNTNGMEVTLTGGNPFPLEAWSAGSRITIGGTEYQIASVNSAKSLTLTSDAGAQNNISYTANNVGVLVRKANAGADTLHVDGVNFRFTFSAEMEMSGSGFNTACAPEPVNSHDGLSGYICVFNSPAGYPGMWFISKDGVSRFLGSPQVPFFADAAAGNIDGNFTGDCIYGFAVSSADPNKVFCPVVSSQSGSGLLLFEGTYHPEGRVGCNDPVGYAGIPGGFTCLFTWRNLTKPSENRSLLQQISAASNYSQAFYGDVRLFAAMGRHLGFYAWTNQDGLAYTFWFDETGTLVSTQDYHSELPCRWCGVHSLFGAGQQDDGAGGWNAAVVKDFPSKHHEAPVLAVDGSTGTAMSTSLVEACPEDIPQELKDKGATGNRCVTITLPGDPCQASATAKELANLPACPWQSGSVLLQPMAPGDEAYGVQPNGQLSGERMMVVKSLGSNRWVLLRNLAVLSGSLLGNNGSIIANHSAGWKLRMACSAAIGSGYVWINYTDASAPKRRDLALSPAQHGDISPLGTVLSSDYCPDVNLLCLNIWLQPIPERINQQATGRKFTGRIFQNVSVEGFDVFRQYVQTHPSWRQLRAEEHDRFWYLDGNPWAPWTGGFYGLWNQSAALVTGSLYRLTSLSHTPLLRKILPTVAWAGQRLLQDVSGPGSVITGGGGDAWKYCVADQAGECVSGSTVGSVYMNIPGATNEGSCGESFYYRRPCFTSLVNAGVGISQYGGRKSDINNFGLRYLTGHLQRHNMTWTYSNASPIPNGKFAVIGGTWLGGRRNDLLLMKLPRIPERDSINRADFVPVRVAVGGYDGSTKIRVRFGYADNGAAEDYYCTTRREACVTGGTPYSWIGEAPAAQTCGATGCQVRIPAISGRVLYYVVDRLNNAGAVIDSTTRGAVAVP